MGLVSGSPRASVSVANTLSEEFGKHAHPFARAIQRPTVTTGQELQILYNSGMEVSTPKGLKFSTQWNWSLHPLLQSSVLPTALDWWKWMIAMRRNVRAARGSTKGITQYNSHRGGHVVWAGSLHLYNYTLSTAAHHTWDFDGCYNGTNVGAKYKSQTIRKLRGKFSVWFLKLSRLSSRWATVFRFFRPVNAMSFNFG